MRSMRAVVGALGVIAAALCTSCAQPGTQGRGARGYYLDRFSVQPGSLSADTGGPFFSLAPGTVLRYRDGDESLTISVLAETRVVDGVTTRIIEEREETPKGLKEVSRNYFAGDPRTGDVYYFGEEVDMYKDGAIVHHEGAWLSGVDGGRFGLIMPGAPKVGQMHYQELAPGVAMDRAEVVSLDERVETPAGVFEGCLHVKETSPLEPGTSHKWYARGVGLIKDGDMVLVTIGK